MTAADLGRFASHFAEWRKIISDTPPEGRLESFTKLAQDAAGYVAEGLNKTAAADTLATIATNFNITTEYGEDTVQMAISDAFLARQEVPDLERYDRPRAPPRKNGPTLVPKKPLPPIQSKADFIKDFVPPDYLIDGMLQRRFIYALTGQTGHAKTAVALLISRLVSSPDRNAMLGTHRVEKGRVIYFVGENPDDVRMRVIGSDSKRDDDPRKDNISFIAGVFDISEMIAVLKADAKAHGEPSLIVVDTSAAYFLGNEELSNTQMGAYARIQRELTKLPGGPCVLVLCHPIKHVQEPSQLLPRGGGAYLAEIDGNLTLWRQTDEMIELWHGKMRGPGFQAMSFKLERIETPKLVDTKGRLISTVQAVAISEAEEERQINKDTIEEDKVLVAMLGDPEGSYGKWAQTIGWTTASGANKKKVERIIWGLGKLVAQADRGKGYRLTEKGIAVAQKAHKRFMEEEQSASQQTLI